MIATSRLLAMTLAMSLPALAAAQNIARPGYVADHSAPAATSAFAPTATITESFDSVTGAPPCPAGWTCTNNSSPLGTSNWFQGNPAVFPAQAGATNAYIGANFNNTVGAATISNWLISPVVQFGNGSQLRFWARVPTPVNFADRLEIRASTGGTNTGGTNTSTGDFSILLGTINPSLVTGSGACASPAAAPGAGAFPDAWCEFLITNTQGIPATGSGRIAFRYFVTDGGPDGANSSYVGIDTFSFVEGVAGGTAPIFAYTPPSGSSLPFTGGTTIGSTGTATITVAVGTPGSGTGATATTTTTCTAPTGPFSGFGQTVTAEGSGAISGAPLTGTCTLGAAPATQTLTCSENRGGTPTAVTYTLDCPAGTVGATAPTFSYSPAAGSTVSFTGGTTVGSTANASITATVATPGSGTGAAATTTMTCTAPTGAFSGFGQTVTAEGTGAISGSPLTGTCLVGAAPVTQTLTCSENRGGTPTPVTFNLECPAGSVVTPLTSTPISGSTVTLPTQTMGGAATTTTISFQNPGKGAATVTCTAPTATEFTVSPLTIPVPGGGTGSTTVTFNSLAVGTFTGVLNCTAGAQTFTFNLSGTTGTAGGASIAIPVGGTIAGTLLVLMTLALGLVTLGWYSRR